MAAQENRTPWRLAIEGILSDEQWHRREDIVAEVSPLIPREVAIRFRRRITRVKRDSKGYERSFNKETEEEVQIGRRAVINNALHNMNRVRRRTESTGEYVRLLPRDNSGRTRNQGAQADRVARGNGEVHEGHGVA